MPKLPRLSGEELVKILQRAGYENRRQRGSHVVLRNGHSVCVIPLHRELKTGTFAGIIRQSGIPLDEFLKLIQS